MSRLCYTYLRLKMSKFIDRLTRVSQGAPQPMGFRMGKASQGNPKMLLVACLEEGGGGSPSLSGAEAGLVAVSSVDGGAQAFKKASAAEDMPWGVWLRGAGAAAAKKTDADFMVFPAAGTPLTAIKGGKMGKVLEVEASLSEGLMRTVDGLPVDAVLLVCDEGNYSITVAHLMLFRRCSDAIGKPVLLKAPAGLRADELRVLWEVGVCGIVVTAKATEISRLGRLIEKTTFSAAARRPSENAILPPLGEAVDAQDELDDVDDEG